jgi:hypothetical protein
MKINTNLMDIDDSFIVNCRRELHTLMSKHLVEVECSTEENLDTLIVIQQKEHTEFFHGKLRGILSSCLKEVGVERERDNTEREKKTDVERTEREKKQR